MAGKSNTAWKATMLRKFNGDEKALQAHMKSIGTRGGKASSGYEFAHGAVDPSVAGKIGGTISRRKKRNDPAN